MYIFPNKYHHILPPSSVLSQNKRGLQWILVNFTACKVSPLLQPLVYCRLWDHWLESRESLSRLGPLMYCAPVHLRMDDPRVTNLDPVCLIAMIIASGP